jgi:hypothetical protein
VLATGEYTNVAQVTAANEADPDSEPNNDDGDQSEDDEDAASVTVADPSFTVSKSCDNEPVPQQGPAIFAVTFVNTGNVDISVSANEDLYDDEGSLVSANDSFDLAEGATLTFFVYDPGTGPDPNYPFSGQSTVDNTINATGSYTDEAGNQWAPDPQSDSASCVVGGKVEIGKRTILYDVDASNEKTWTFGIYYGPNQTGDSTFLNSPLATDTASPGDTLLDFGLGDLDPDLTYTICELGLPAGWASFWQVDTDGDGFADATVIPYNPNESDDPPEDMGNRCYDLTVSAGGTLVFDILNQYPGGGPRTPGYWKNWNRVTGGGQADNADRNGGYLEGFWLLEDVLNPGITGGITWDDILSDSFVFAITNAAVAVDILDQREIGELDVVGDKDKRSSDAAYTLAMHLLAAQLNLGAGAESCDAVLDAALAAETLLDEYDFNGEGAYLRSKGGTRQDYADALELADTLDSYNNGNLCDGETTPPPVDSQDDPPTVSITSPANGEVIGDGGNVPVYSVDITADASDDDSVTQVEFIVEGASIGVDIMSSDGWSVTWDLTAVNDGEYTITAIATDTAEQTGGDSIGVTVDNETGYAMYIGDIDAATTTGKGGKWDATVTMTVDAGFILLDGAAVSGTWSDGTAGSCTTTGGGQCEITLSSINRNRGSVNFTVDDVSASGYDYDAGSNYDPDGDSDGTTIVITKP